MEKLLEEFSLGLFFWQTVLFVGLLFLLKKYAWGPILSAVNEREEGIKNALSAAEKAKKEMENLTKKSKSKGMSKSAYIISRIDQDKIKIDDFNVFINLGMEISDLNYKLEQLEKSNPNQPKILAEIKKIATLSEEIRLKVFQNIMK